MPKRVFLDWSSPLLPLLADKLLPAKGKGPLNLGEFLILAPTQQAGRRLREYLATAWRERGGTALLSMSVHPPSFLLQPGDNAKIAHAFDWMPAWQQTLTGIHPETLPALLPQQTEPFSPAVALEFGQRLQRLREELLDAGLDLSGVASSPLLNSEQERWRDLARLEEAYRAELAQKNLQDPTDAKRQQIQNYTPPVGIQKIILAGVPDPSPVILHRLKELDQTIEMEVWIHAPASEADQFNEWGMPEASWQNRFLGRSGEPEGWIECLADPAALCQRLTAWMKDLPAQPDLAFGLLDDNLVLPIQHSLQACGHELYHPKPAKLAESPDLRLLNALQEHRQHEDPVSLRALWRQPDLLRALQPDNPRGLLKAWETFANQALPENADSVSETLKDEPLKSAWEKLKRWIGVQDARGLLNMLEEIHAGRKLDPGNPEQRYQLRQLHKLAEVLQEGARRQKEGFSPSAGVLLQVLKNETVDPPRVEGTFTAEGWLELAYHPSPSLLLTGFQEGKVPAVNKPDPFLPNQLREELGLRSDRDWLARDAFLFHSMIMSRDPGQVRIWVLKRDREGGPLLPSRLLFACDDETLLQRAELLFREPPPPALQSPPSPGLALDPSRLPAREIDRLSVSAVKSYLRCPSRFYFEHVLGLRLKDDLESEPHAGVFGECIHAVLKTVVDQGACPQPEWNQRCEEALEQYIRLRFGSARRMSMQVFRHAALSRLKAAGHVQRELWSQGWKTIATERKLTRECGGITVSGVIDRIDFHPEHGFRIIDYKTHDKPEPPAKTHLSTPRPGREMIQLQVGRYRKQWTDLQLPLYRWLAASEPQVDPSRPLEVLYFNLPKAVQDTTLENWKEENELREEAEKCLHTVIGLVKDQVWLPSSDIKRFDDFTPLLHHGNDWIPR
ncbi:PD-(D/E)XK nuclease family protein [Kiritimatiellaeota bacterium B1221]|nr:PD-(D/E)XK nuclease family protein [Kiritimatiellaeota bacterium B1221]